MQDDAAERIAAAFRAPDEGEMGVEGPEARPVTGYVGRGSVVSKGFHLDCLASGV